MKFKSQTQNVILFVALFFFSLTAVFSQNTPTLNDDRNIPVLNRMKNVNWGTVGALSDEFNGNNLNSKWTSDPSSLGFNWEGRFPGLFEQDNVSLFNGELFMEAEKFPTPKRRPGAPGDNRLWEYGGAIIRSVETMKPGMYTEASMMTTQTHMSGTFWLVTNPSTVVCNTAPYLELDITESTGVRTQRYRINDNTVVGADQAPAWMPNISAKFENGMNAHVRLRQYNSCGIPSERATRNLDIRNDVNPDAGYNTYGFWWESPTQLHFFFNGRYESTIAVPKFANGNNVPFNVPMHLVMAIETYQQNATSGNDVIDGFRRNIPGGGTEPTPKWNRSTKYKWVRTFNNNGSTDGDSGNFFIQNRATGKFIRPQFDADNSIIGQAPNTYRGDYTQWQRVNVDSTYFHLKNKKTGKFLRPQTTAIDAPLIQSPTSNDAQWQTQWKQVNTSGGYFYLENRWTGKYFRPIGNDDLDGSTGNDFGMQLKPQSYNGGFTQWKFLNVSSKITDQKETLSLDDNLIFFPNPAENRLNIIAKASNYHVDIYDIGGRVIRSIDVEKDATREVDITDFASGIYLAKYQSEAGDATFTKKIVKQ